MKKQSGNRNFNMPDADLYVQSMARIQFAQRDIELFEKYGYSRERLAGFANQCEKFRSEPDDHEFVGDQMMATEKKAAAAEALRSAIRAVMARVAMKYHTRTGRYRKFGTMKLSDISDPALLFCAKRVVRVARQMEDFLEGTGLKEDHLKKINDRCADLEQAMHIQQDRIHDRDIAVERRMEQGNKLYEELMKVAEIGKSIWEERGDRSKYEQYVVYERNPEYEKAVAAGTEKKMQSTLVRLRT